MMVKCCCFTVIVLGFLLVSPLSTLHAQDAACPELVQSAYELTQEVCDGIGDDEACYGNLRIEVTPADLSFGAPGDLAGLAEIESLRLSSMDELVAEWGISLIHVAALVSEDDPPQSVELVLFGNVEITNAAEEDSGFAPMQAFTFTSGANDRPCEEAPDSGLMVQTPQGAGEISLLVNEVAIDLGSTAYLQAVPGGQMRISIVDGQADVSAKGTTITVPAGARARVPLDANGLADGPPIGPEPYDDASLQTLPLALLTDEIVIAPPQGGQAGGQVPIAGMWVATAVLRTGGPRTAIEDCQGPDNIEPFHIEFHDNQLVVTEPYHDTTYTNVYLPTEPDIFVQIDGENTYLWRVITPELMEYDTTSPHPRLAPGGCVWQWEFVSTDE